MELVRVPLRRSIPPRAWPVRSSAGPRRRLWPSRKGLLERERPGGGGWGVCASPPAAMPAPGIEADGSLPSTARWPGSAPAVRRSWRNVRAASDMQHRRGAHRTSGFRAHRPRCLLHTARSPSGTRFLPQPAARSSSRAKLRPTVTCTAFGSAGLRLSAAPRYDEGSFRHRLFRGIGRHPSPGQARIWIGKNVGAPKITTSLRPRAVYVLAPGRL